MKYLLDTHVLLWASDDNERHKLSSKTAEILTDTAQELFISRASLWEIAIKSSLGKLRFLQEGVSAIYKYLNINGIKMLDLEDSYIEIVEKMPFVHRDPFDRLLIATALAENMTMITADTNIQKYPVKWAW